VHSSLGCGVTGTVALLPAQPQLGGTGPSGCQLRFVHRRFSCRFWGGFSLGGSGRFDLAPHAETYRRRPRSARPPTDQLPPFGPLV